MDELYDTLMNAGLSEDEIEKQILQKAEDFQGFITKKGILFLIAKEMGLSIQSSEIEPELYEEFEEDIDYDEFTIKISEVQENMSNIVLLGRIQKNLGIRHFNRKDGTPGVVGSFLLNDGTKSIKIVLWSDHVKVMESEYFKINEIVRIIGAYSKMGINKLLEIHLGKKGKILLSPKNINPGKIPQIRPNLIESVPKMNNNPNKIIQKIQNLNGFIKNVEGVITNIDEFKEIDKKNGEKSFLLKLIISDETSSIKLILWDMKAIECLRLINVGDYILLSNVLIKTNSYTGEKEITFTQYSRLKKI